MSAVTRTAEARMRLVRALVRQKSTAAAAAGKPIAHIYPNSETPVKALDPCGAASRSTNAAPRALATLQRSYASPREKEGRRLTRANRHKPGTPTGGRGTLRVDASSTSRARTAAQRREDERTRKHTRATPRRPRDELTQNDTQARHLRAPPHGPVGEGPARDVEDDRLRKSRRVSYEHRAR